MTEAADRIFTNAEVHTLADPDETHEAVAVRDGEIVSVDSAYEIAFLEGVETDVVDLDGRVLLPGFTDAHTHMEAVGRYEVYADLRPADGVEDCVELLAESTNSDDSSTDDWILGYGYDESTWSGEQRYLTSDDLDAVSEDRPVAAVREDGHLASLNSVALDRLVGEMASENVRREGGEPTGVVVEDAVGVVRAAVAPDRAATRDLLTAARDRAHALGVTGVHDMVRRSHKPRVYRELDREGALDLRVRLNYWSDHVDALVETGLTTNHGSEFVRVGAIKSFTDGSFGGRTAKLTEPYADADEGSDHRTGQWVVAPDELRDLVERADGEGFQLTVHAIGDAAVGETLDAFVEGTDDPGAARHRVEHAELLDAGHVEQFADSGVVASVQPNFLKWAREGGLYAARLGDERRARTNRFRDLLEADVHLAFGSDCMPLDPLFGVHQTVNAPEPSQRLSVTEALRAYTRGAAYAGFDEDRLGTVEAGKKADLVALERSPWEHSGAIEDIDVALTVVDGEVVYDGR